MGSNKTGSSKPALPKTALPLMATFTPILPYLLSWGVLAVLMIEAPSPGSLKKRAQSACDDLIDKGAIITGE